MAACAGFVTILGSPNVGKSTLMNALVGERVSIVSPKQQTTRHQIMGVVSTCQHRMSRIIIETSNALDQMHRWIDRWAADFQVRAVSRRLSASTQSLRIQPCSRLPWSSLDGCFLSDCGSICVWGVQVTGEDFQIVYYDTPGVLRPNYKLQVHTHAHTTHVHIVHLSLYNNDIYVYWSDHSNVLHATIINPLPYPRLPFTGPLPLLSAGHHRRA